MPKVKNQETLLLRAPETKNLIGPGTQKDLGEIAIKMTKNLPVKTDEELNVNYLTTEQLPVDYSDKQQVGQFDIPDQIDN